MRIRDPIHGTLSVSDPEKAVIDSPEFWEPKYYDAKVKSPFEYVASAVRAIGGVFDDPALIQLECRLVDGLLLLGQEIQMLHAPRPQRDGRPHLVGIHPLHRKQHLQVPVAYREAARQRRHDEALSGGLEGRRGDRHKIARQRRG